MSVVKYNLLSQFKLFTTKKQCKCVLILCQIPTINLLINSYKCILSSKIQSFSSEKYNPLSKYLFKVKDSNLFNA